MNPITFFLRPHFGTGGFAVLAGESGRAGEKKGEKEAGLAPGHLVEVDTNDIEPGKARGVKVEAGSILQISVFCQTKPGEDIRTLKVDVSGDSLQPAGGVVRAPVWDYLVPGDKSTKLVSSGDKHLCVFLVALRAGKATVRVTPLGADGKARPTREVAVTVLVIDREKAR